MEENNRPVDSDDNAEKSEQMQDTEQTADLENAPEKIDADQSPPIPDSQTTSIAESDETDTRSITALSANDSIQTEELNSNQSGNNVNEERLKEIFDFMQSIKSDLELRNERDKWKDEAMNRMSKQIDDFERGLIKDIKKTLIMGIINYIDSLLRFQRKFSSIENSDLQNEIVFLIDELIITLSENDVELIDESPGAVYNRDIHKPKGKIDTESPEENNTIHEIVKKGYIWSDDIIVRKQEVIIKELNT